VARNAALQADADTARKDAERAMERRNFWIGRDRDGTARVGGLLTIECAAFLRAAIKAHDKRTGTADERTPGQRRHDALLEVARQQVQGGSGLRKRRTRVFVTATVDTLLAKAGAPAPLMNNLVGISQEELDQCLCEADLVAIIKDLAGNVIYRGKAARFYSQAKKEASAVRNPTCDAPGCTVPADECEACHVIRFSASGETVIEGEANGCVGHHRLEHVMGWAFIRAANGVGWDFVPPTDPRNPRTGLDPQEYLRRRREAITARMLSKRRKAKQKKDPGSGAESARQDDLGTGEKDVGTAEAA
jgi:hypothetical protein